MFFNFWQLSAFWSKLRSTKYRLLKQWSHRLLWVLLFWVFQLRIVPVCLCVLPQDEIKSVLLLQCNISIPQPKQWLYWSGRHCVCYDTTWGLNSHFHVCHKHHIGNLLYRLLIRHKILWWWDLVLSVNWSKIYRGNAGHSKLYYNWFSRSSDDAALVLQYLNLNVCCS